MQVLIKPQKQAVFVIALVNWGVMSTTNVEGLNTAILDRKYAYERALRARVRFRRFATGRSAVLGLK